MKMSFQFGKASVATSMLVVGLIIGLQPAANAMDTSNFSLDAGFRWEDNLSLSPKSADKVSDLTTHVSVAGNFDMVDTETDKFSFTASAHYDLVSDTRDLSNYGAKLAMSYQKSLGTEFNDPWLSLDADGQLIEYKDSDIRDGYIANIGVTLGRQLNPKFGISGGYRYFMRRSSLTDLSMMQVNWKAGEVFDLNRHNLFVHLNYAANDKTSVYADINYFDGDVAASGRSFSNGLGFPRDNDPVFGPGYKVWKIDATGYESKLGMVYQISETISVDAFASFLSVSGAANNDYDNTVIQALMTYQF